MAQLSAHTVENELSLDYQYKIWLYYSQILILIEILYFVYLPTSSKFLSFEEEIQYQLLHLSRIFRELLECFSESTLHFVKVAKLIVT